MRHRIGIDLGGTKTEAAVLGAGRRGGLAAARGHAEALCRDRPHDGRAGAGGRVGAGRGGDGRGGDPRGDQPGQRAGQEREHAGADRACARPGSRSGARPARAGGERRELLRAERGGGRGRGRRALCVRGDPRDGLRRRDRGGRAGIVGPASDRRRVGAHAAALAAGGRAAAAECWCGQRWVPRALPCRARIGPELRGAGRGGGARTGGGGRLGKHRARSSAMRTGWRAGWR